MRAAMCQWRLSTHAYHRVRKRVCTVVDLAGAERIAASRTSPRRSNTT